MIWRSPARESGAAAAAAGEDISARTAPIIIKKVSGHGGHHGGAWKVAYADFVTAMMALFIVLWLLNTSKQVQEAVGGYFKDPTGTSKMVGSTMRGAGQNLDLRKEDMKKIKEALEKQIKSLPDFEKLKKHIEMTITAEGLRIELTEGEKGTFFELGSAVPSASGKELLVALAQELGKLPNSGFDRRTHGLEAVLGRAERIQQLGAFGGPRQRGTQDHAKLGAAGEAGFAGTGICGSTAARPEQLRTIPPTGESR